LWGDKTVALEAALNMLVTDLEKLNGILGELDINAGDFGEPEAGHLATEVCESITELFGRSKGALSLAGEARDAGGEPFDPNKLRRSLAESQKNFQILSRNLFSNLLSFERIGDLVGFAREHKPWNGWVNSVRVGLERCRLAVEAVDDGYFACWQEMAERVASSPVAVHTTNIGQQITTEALTSREAAQAAGHAGLT
jgi:hypothetical protein